LNIQKPGKARTCKNATSTRVEELKERELPFAKAKVFNYP
jgi:hypothetical protein